jgi:hypothetical protein
MTANCWLETMTGMGRVLCYTLSPILAARTEKTHLTPQLIIVPKSETENPWVSNWLTTNIKVSVSDTILVHAFVCKYSVKEN